MTKAILVMDMPKDCPMCPVAHYNKLDEFTGCDIVGGKRYAMTTDKDYKDTIGRPAWCPLKPMPEAIPIDWLIKTQDEYSQRYGVVYKAVVINLIEDWRQENEE